MAKRKGASHSGTDQFIVTQANLDKKGKTNKKLKRNPMASKYLSVKGQELKDAAKAYMEAHPAGSGRRKQAKLKAIENKVNTAS
jgi:hypothetical protein